MSGKPVGMPIAHPVPFLGCGVCTPHRPGPALSPVRLDAKHRVVGRMGKEGENRRFSH